MFLGCVIAVALPPADYTAYLRLDEQAHALVDTLSDDLDPMRDCVVNVSRRDGKQVKVTMKFSLERNR